MKKDLIFSPILLAIGVLLFMLRAVGMTAHIIISILGIAALIAYTVTTKKDWKIPALEVIMRVFYGVALITGEHYLDRIDEKIIFRSPGLRPDLPAWHSFA